MADVNDTRISPSGGIGRRARVAKLAETQMTQNHPRINDHTVGSNPTSRTNPRQLRKSWLKKSFDAIEALYPGTEKIYGPYLNSQKDRYQIALFSGGKQRTTQYAKIKVEVANSRRLKDDEVVDHINRNPKDDRYQNLQVLTRSEHAHVDHVFVKPVIAVCAWCKKEFQLRRDQRSKRAMAPNKGGPFCSRQCSGKYGTHIQYGKGGIKRTERQRKVYYRIKKV